jgi:hypothetical protein
MTTSAPTQMPYHHPSLSNKFFSDECKQLLRPADSYHVDEERADTFDEPSDEELELLECADDFCSRSRLSCQLVVTEACDGTRREVPEDNG